MANIEQKLDELAQVVSSNQTIAKFGLAATSLLAYDLFITFHREVTCIWKRQWSAVTFVYAAIRYCTLLNMTLQCVLGFMASPPNITTCVRRSA
ncbi:hypothetical protein QCA50_016142 [Cerrena zonata]|uniref:DUF6533 domain-containing protein n=1 Tax=Cerrena zonata TaxID=2478898 RepID=A0AAW0FU75_9APHY